MEGCARPLEAMLTVSNKVVWGWVTTSHQPAGAGEGAAAGAGWYDWLSVARVWRAQGPEPRTNQDGPGVDPLSDGVF